MEFPSHTSEEMVVNLLDTIRDSKVNAAIEIANYRLANAHLTNEDTDEVIRSCTESVDFEIGDGYIEGNAIVTGTVYDTDEEGLPDGSRQVVKDRSLVYFGADVKAVRGEPEIVLVFYENITNDRFREGEVENIYFALPEKLSKLDLIITEEVDDVLSHYAEQCALRLTDDEFLLAQTAEQQDHLERVIALITKDLKAYEGLTLRIETDYYMGIYDEMPLSLENSRVDQSENPPEGCVAPTGKYLWCMFAELVDQPDRGFDSENGFHLSHNSPCILLRDEARQMTYFVPIADIYETTIVDDPAKT